ncbi:hypothetical protein [Roseofilum casamattae]|uniref:Transposase n=1 Tax=Roseofilum casamattae BLCC-M143 TaxID=3022442 RepID=A0ABT7C3J0_9CYAN|nr:hypothetical protein [Roseofilum casamattae]MDJ1185271.1 hypothetical protein [Roseofilum casamattae BLCC-M143]
MYVLSACLGSAAERSNKLNYSSNIFKSLTQKLELGAKRARDYHKKWDSIYWKNANAASKRRVKSALREIAWDVADAVRDSMNLFNQFCDEQAGLRSKMVWQIPKIRTSLFLANDDLWATYSSQIKCRQLKLFDIVRFEVTLPEKKTVSKAAREEPRRSPFVQLELPLFGDKIVRFRGKIGAIASAA